MIPKSQKEIDYRVYALKINYVGKAPNMLPASLCMDPEAYVESMKRMKTLIENFDYIIPGHDDLVFSKFPKVKDWVVKIGN